MTKASAPRDFAALATERSPDFLGLSETSANPSPQVAAPKSFEAEITQRIVAGYVEKQNKMRSINFNTAFQRVENRSEAKQLMAREIPGFGPVIMRQVNWSRVNTFSALQEWEGHVVDVKDDCVIVSLTDLTIGSKRATEEAEIPLAEINESDWPKLTPGSVFRWAIGYQRSASGTRMRVSNIVFRDLPQWTQNELEETDAEAERITRFMNRNEQAKE